MTYWPVGNLYTPVGVSVHLTEVDCLFRFGTSVAITLTASRICIHDFRTMCSKRPSKVRLGAEVFSTSVVLAQSKTSAACPTWCS